MLGGLIRRLIGGGRSTDRTEELAEEIEELRKEVLASHDDLDSRIAEIEEWRNQRDAHIDENTQAVEHLIEAIAHNVKEDTAAEDDGFEDEILAYLAEIEERVARLENSSTPEKTGQEASSRPSKRSSKRLVDEDGRTSNVVETAEGAKAGEQLWGKATPAQRSVLQAMYDAGYPMSYREIAEQVGRSVSTVKNHINNLKSAGYDFKEDTAHNNAKKYMLDERVKAFLTLRLNE